MAYSVGDSTKSLLKMFYYKSGTVVMQENVLVIRR